MSRADINLKNNNDFSNQQNPQNLDEFEGVWQTLDGVNEISFELLLPKNRIQSASDDIEQNIGDDFLAVEELMMRQNLVDLALKENISVKNNKEDGVNLLVKEKSTEYTRAFNFNLSKMTEDDISFFKLLADKQSIAINNQNSIVVENSDGELKTENMKFSRSFLNLIQYTFKSQRPIRIDFDKNASVIIRINPQGRVSAEFIASDAVMEHLLKTNIPQLKKKLDSSGIKYKKIYYRDEEEE